MSVFVIRAALWSKKLECCFKYCRSWKNTLGKPAVTVNPRYHLIRALKERTVIPTVEICVLCRWWFSNQFGIVSETAYSVIQLAVSCGELYFARSYALKRTGKFASGNKVTCLFCTFLCRPLQNNNVKLPSSSSSSASFLYLHLELKPSLHI